VFLIRDDESKSKPTGIRRQNYTLSNFNNDLELQLRQSQDESAARRAILKLTGNYKEVKKSGPKKKK
jgi:hypothetical protein